MTMLKKFGTAFLAVVFSVSALTTASTQAHDLSELQKTDEGIEIMLALEIFEEGKENIYNPEAYTSRQEFAGMLGRMFDLSSSAPRQVFEDVPAGAENAAYIASAYDMGIFQGDGSGKFRPNDAVTYIEAVKSILYAAGYGEYIKATNDTTYVKTLSKTKLSKGLRFGNDMPMSYADIAKLFVNALEVPAVYSDAYSTNGDMHFETDPSRTVLTEFMDMYEYTGVVTADGYSYVDNSLDTPCDRNHIMIDGILCEYKGGKDLLGMRVKAYIKDDNNIDRALYCTIDDRNEIVHIGYRDMEYSSGEIRYAPQDGKGKSYTLQTGTSVIYNGKFVGKTGTSYVTDADFDINSGYVQLIDNNSDGGFDVVKLTEYDTVYTAESYTEENVVVDYYKNSILKLDESGKDYIFYHKGIEVPMGRIRRYNVISIAASRDGKLVRVYLSDKNITGKITAIEDDTITIGENEYYISSYYSDMLAQGHAQATQLRLGAAGIFYLNEDGEIAAFASAASENYGYIVRKGDATFRSNGEVKLYTASGEFEIYEIADKVNFIKGTSSEKLPGKEILSKLDLYSVIRFELDSSHNIKEIELPTSSAQGQEDLFTKHVDKTSLMYQLEVLGATYVIGTKTIVLNVPDPDKGYDVDDITNYSTKPFFRTGVSYTVSIYDADAYRTAGVVVNFCDTPGGPLTTAAAEPAAVGKVRYVNHDGEMIPEMTLWQAGVEKTAKIADTSLGEDTDNTSATAWVVGDFKVSDLNFGDIIQYNTAQDNYLNKFRVLYRPAVETAPVEKVSSGYTITPTTYRAGMYTAHGKVLRLNKNQFVYSTPDDGEKVVAFNAYTKVYIIDMTEKTIKAATNNDLRPEDDIFFFLTQDRLYSMFIYRW